MAYAMYAPYQMDLALRCPELESSARNVSTLAMCLTVNVFVRLACLILVQAVFRLLMRTVLAIQRYLFLREVAIVLAIDRGQLDSLRSLRMGVYVPTSTAWRRRLTFTEDRTLEHAVYVPMDSLDQSQTH